MEEHSLRSFGKDWMKSKDIRRLRVSSGVIFGVTYYRDFLYGIIFQIHENEIFVAAVMHLRRKPDYWAHRQGQQDAEENCIPLCSFLAPFHFVPYE